MLKKIRRAFKRTVMGYGLKAYNLLDPATKQIVLEDLARVEPFEPGQEMPLLKKTLELNISFRSILYFRILKSENQEAIRDFGRFSRMYPPAPGIELDGEIGGGLRIIHHCCVVAVEKAGKNLSVGPFAVVGKKHGGCPVIGDNVTVCANSTVVGNIQIGDNALIGASSFVDKDVPAGLMVCGNPAGPVKHHGEMEK